MRTTRRARGDVLGAQRIQDVHHARPDLRRDGGDGGHRSRRRPQGRLGVHRRAGQPGHVARQEGRQARHARAATRARCCSTTAAFRRIGCVGVEGAGLHQHDAGARRRAHRHRGAVGRSRAGRLRGGAALRARAQVVRQADLRLPGDSVEARRRGDEDRSGAAADATARRT